MQEVFEKIIEKLEEKIKEYDERIERRNGACYFDETDKIRKLDDTANGNEQAIEIVKQEAEQFGTDINVGSNGWIPCSVAMPEESELVLIYAESTARGGSIRVVAQLDNGFWFAQTSSDTFGLTGIGQYNVVAWQPLPAPYQPKGE